MLPGTYDRPDDQELEFVTSNTNGNDTGKNIVLMSRDGAATTFLDGENKRVFEIVNGTDTTLQIIGFTIFSQVPGGTVVSMRTKTSSRQLQPIVFIADLKPSTIILNLFFFC